MRAARIGYAPRVVDVTVTPGAPVTANFSLTPAGIILEQVVTTGYGTQRREAITGSVATVSGEDANVGVVTNANDMIQGRVAGVELTPNNGEPGAGAQIRIRGGTSISASNEPLYVIDGVPINNSPTESRGIMGGDVGGFSPSLQRSPLNLLNPVRHRIDHDPEGRVGDRDLWKPRRERRDSHSDEEGRRWWLHGGV